MKNYIYQFSLGILLLGVICFAAITLAARADAGMTCCTVTGIDVKSGMVTVKENATGLTFTFPVKNPKLLKAMKIGQGVAVDFDSGIVTGDTAKGPGDQKVAKDKEVTVEEDEESAVDDDMEEVAEESEEEAVEDGEETVEKEVVEGKKAIRSAHDKDLKVALIEMKRRGTVIVANFSVQYLKGNNEKDEDKFFKFDVEVCCGLSYILDYETATSYRPVASSGFLSGEIRKAEGEKTFQVSFKAPKKDVSVVAITLGHVGTFDDVKIGK